jgi:peroxiredoxin
MKNILILVAGLGILTACKNSDQEKTGKGIFTVSGVAKNAANKKVLLQEVELGSQQIIIKDSGKTDDKGAFSLKGMANEEGIYQLLVAEEVPMMNFDSKGQTAPGNMQNNLSPLVTVLVINDGKKIELSLDAKDAKNYTVTGSKGSQEIMQTMTDYKQFDQKISAAYKAVDSLSKTKTDDATMVMASQKREQELKGWTDYLNQSINKSESPAYKYFAVGMLASTLPLEELSKTAASIAAKHPTHSGLQKLKKIIDQQIAMSQGPQNNGTEAPNLTMQDLNGKTMSISDFKGKFVLVDFWASWCGPCREENPNVVAAYNKFKDKNFTILGVSLDDNKEKWKKAVEADGLTWNHMSDLKKWSSEAVQAYRFQGIPYNVLIDPSGKIVASNLRGPELEAALAKMLK